MKRTRDILCLVILASGVCSAQHSPRQTIAKIIPTLRTKTAVPLRLPTYLSGLDNGDFYAILKFADAKEYVIVLGATPDCQGQHNCSYGTLIGTTHDPESYIPSDRKAVPVSLRHALKGYFYATVCGAYCDDSVMVWSEGEYHYLITLKAETKQNMIRTTNSAIERANQWP